MLEKDNILFLMMFVKK